jgi:hypothetical protein
MNDPTDIRSQARDAQHQTVVQQKRRAQEIEDFKWLMSHKQGRRIVWRILEQAGVYRQTFTGNSETFFREGKRSIGLFVLAEVHEVSADAYVSMLKENQNGR